MKCLEPTACFARPRDLRLTLSAELPALAHELLNARPVRLSDITRIGEGDALWPQWREVPPGRYVHGCLTERGVYAVYDSAVALVQGPKGE